ncbi:MAG: hypothetical protein IH956_04665 [Chloroflexi bacterium]|nr:hypothetical protein [Chloroflexota bacterium]
MKRPETRLAAGGEYHRKTTDPHQMWATDASYFKVIGWGYYYLVTVMDDYSRFALMSRVISPVGAAVCGGDRRMAAWGFRRGRGRRW